MVSPTLTLQFTLFTITLIIAGNYCNKLLKY